VPAAPDRLDRAVRDQAEALGQGGVSDPDLARADERLDALEGQARHVAFLVGRRNPRDPGDAFVSLTLAVRHGAGVDAVATLARLYVDLGRRHHLEGEVLDVGPPESLVQAPFV
jgi:hypothetical protein